MLEEYIRQYIAAQDVPVVSFTWQGGEPTLLRPGALALRSLREVTGGMYG